MSLGEHGGDNPASHLPPDGVVEHGDGHRGDLVGEDLRRRDSGANVLAPFQFLPQSLRAEFNVGGIGLVETPLL